MDFISNDNKRIVRNTLLLYMRLLFNLILGLVTSRLLLRNLGIEDYGIYNLVGGFVSLLSIFSFSISGSCQRFLVFELGRGNKKKLSDTFCTISIMLIVFSLLFFFSASLVGIWFVTNILNIPIERLNVAVFVFFCSLVVFCLQILVVPYNSLVIAHERMDFYALMSIVESSLRLIVVVLMASVLWDKLLYYAITILLINFGVGITYILYCKYFFNESKLHWIFVNDIFREISSFTIWVGTGSFAGLLKDHGGNILINLFFGVVLNAACGIANQVRSIVNQLSSNIGLAVSPQITKAYSAGDKDRAVRLTFLLAKTQTLMIMLVALPIFVEAPNLMALWLGDIPDFTVCFVRAILIFCITQVLEQSYGPLFLAIGKVRRFEIIAGIITLQVLPITYFCYYLQFHPVSYYIVCIGFEVFLFMYSYLFLYNEIKFPLGEFLREVILRVILVATITILIHMLLHGLYCNIEYIYLKMVLNILLIMAIFLFFAFYGGINARERQITISYIKSIVHK